MGFFWPRPEVKDGWVRDYNGEYHHVESGMITESLLIDDIEGMRFIIHVKGVLPDGSDRSYNTRLSFVSRKKGERLMKEFIQELEKKKS